MRVLAGLLMLAVLAGCAAGPVQVAKTEAETFKTKYNDPELAKLYAANEAKLKDIYTRFRRAGVDFYFDGVGVTSITGLDGRKYTELMLKIRPADLVFDEKTSTAEQRFSTVMRVSFPRYLKYLQKSDVQGEGIHGIAFGIYWPVRDFALCDTKGGFIEYAIAYLSTEDVYDILDGIKPFLDVAKTAEVVSSLDLKPAKSVRIVE